MGIKSVHIQNFKSIKDSGKIELNNLNVLIGANGSGKSNFIEFFNFLKKIASEELRTYRKRNGSLEKDGIDNILHFGRKKSNLLSVKISFYSERTNSDYDNYIEDGYIFDLILDIDNKFVFAKEEGFYLKKDGSYYDYRIDVYDMYADVETSLRKKPDIQGKRNKYILNYIELFKIYHFNDTSMTSNMKSPSIIDDNQLFLKEDGSDIASFIYNFSKKYPKEFKMLEETIRYVAPFFNRFHLVPKDADEIYLRWVENDENETIFPIGSLSDGTLRFICLASILMHPVKPMTIILDEPELGLHPYSVVELAALIDIASENCQIILATQSIDLIAQFSADDIIVVKRENNETKFEKQSEKKLEKWLKNYSIGEIWNKNIIGGNP